MKHSLYERIGGDAAVEATVTKMYEKILSDPLLVPFFQQTDMEKQRRSQIAFVTYAFGGPNHYTGRGMRNAHKKAVENGLSEQHFNAVAGHLKAAMEELSVPQELIAEALQIVGTTKADVLNQ